MASMMCEVADRGYLAQMTITYDRWFFNPRGPATDDNPQLLNEKVGLGHLFESFAPRLAKKRFRRARAGDDSGRQPAPHSGLLTRSSIQ